MNLKDAKEVRSNVEKIISKRNTAKQNEKVTTKKVTTKKETKKEKDMKKKFRKFLLKFIVIEYMVCAGVMLVLNYNSLAVENQIKDHTIRTQQETIFKLLNTNDNKELPETVTKQTNYMSAVEKPAEKDSRAYLGKFKITHYCACKKCCGPNAQGITASGKRVEENKTIAVDPSVIKLGSKVYIDGYGYMEAQDTGSAIKGNIIDVYIADHQEALQLGVVYKDVYLVK